MLSKGKKRRLSKQIDKPKSESWFEVEFWNLSLRTQYNQLNYQYMQGILNQHSHAEECKREKERGPGRKMKSHNTQHDKRIPNENNLIRMSFANISCLKHWETALAETVKGAPFSVFACCESASKYLHSEESKDEDEQNEQHEQRVDGGDGVHEGLYQVTHRAPVSEVRFKYFNSAISPDKFLPLEQIFLRLGLTFRRMTVSNGLLITLAIKFFFFCWK